MEQTLFFRIENGKLVLWDYQQHAQYEIDIAHLNRIMEISAGSNLGDTEIDKNILHSNIFKNRKKDNWGWDCLSHIFHIGTQISESEKNNIESQKNAYKDYIDYCKSIYNKIPELNIELTGKTLKLPSPDLNCLDKKSLLNVLLNRKTCRNFFAEPVDIKDISTTLWATFGSIHGESRKDLEALGLEPIGYRRSSPSGGSLHPSEAYLISMRINGIPPGIYHYRSHKHELSIVRDHFIPQDLGSLLCEQNFANDLSYGIFITSRFDKLWWKYPHSRAYRVALLDIGCLIQTFQLVSTAQGIQTWPTGYFIDQSINNLLNISSSRESAMFFLGGGRGNGPVARDVLALIDS